MISKGETLERTASTYIAPQEQIRPCGDKIILKPLRWEPSKIIECVRTGRPIRGEILAIGKGAYKTIRNKERSKLKHTNQFIHTTLKKGDQVELGGLNIFDGNGYIFDTINWGNEQSLVIQEADVAHSNGKPLHDRILVKPIPQNTEENGFYIQEQKQDISRGTITAIGSDVKDLKAGNEIGYGNMTGVETTIGSESYLVMRESDVMFVVES